MRIRQLSVLCVFGTLLAACADHGTSPTAVRAPNADAAAGAPLAARAASGTWVSGTYGNAYGARYYRIYIPSPYTGGTARPLMVMLHGCSQDGYDFAAATRMNSFAESRNFIVLYPEQGTAYNGADCWNWYYSANQARGSGEPSLIAGMIARVKSNYNINSAKVGVAGFSAGAAMANIMGCTYPDHIKTVASFAGVMYKGATTGVGGTNAMLYGSSYSANTRGTDCYNAMGSREHVIPTLVFHGTADYTVKSVNAQQTLAQWAQANDLANDGVNDNDIDATADSSATATACRSYTRYDYKNSGTGAVTMRKYIISGLGHRWSGGSTSGSYADPCGPDASSIIANFFGF